MTELSTEPEQPTGPAVAGAPLEVSAKVAEADVAALALKVARLGDMGTKIISIPPTELLAIIAAGAIAMNASDIHMEAEQTQARLRYRVDGVLQDAVRFDRTGWQALLSRIKVLAKLKLNVHEVPQDGSFVLQTGERTFDVRVSMLPGGYGENIAMRLLDRSLKIMGINELGLRERDFAVVQAELRRSNGMILVTGPTGAGKSTSLAAFLKEVNDTKVKIITLEDPIEYRLPGVEHTQVNVAAGYTYSAGLRAAMRQDPDIIMIGEIRDAEAAETALHAALTGHLVFSTLHTNDTSGAVTRLIDMGIKRYVLAPALNLVMAQRLVRRVCAECAEAYSPERAVRERILKMVDGLPATILDKKTLRDPAFTLLRARGCAACHQTGYRGRTGIFEVFAVNGAIEELVLKGASSQEVRLAAQKEGMTTVAQDGVLKALARLTTLEEVDRVTDV